MTQGGVDWQARWFDKLTTNLLDTWIPAFAGMTQGAGKTGEGRGSRLRGNDGGRRALGGEGGYEAVDADGYVLADFGVDVQAHYGGELLA